MVALSGHVEGNGENKQIHKIIQMTIFRTPV
jgi:hypothetical protein